MIECIFCDGRMAVFANFPAFECSKFYGRPVCGYCGDTYYSRQLNFADPHNGPRDWRKSRTPYDFMRKEQLETVFLEWLVSELWTDIKRFKSGKLNAKPI